MAYIKQNMPTRVIGLKLGRPEGGVRGKVGDLGLSLKPVNQSPNKRAKEVARRAFWWTAGEACSAAPTLLNAFCNLQGGFLDQTFGCARKHLHE